jgi:hypothetical protein
MSVRKDSVVSVSTNASKIASGANIAALLPEDSPIICAMRSSY